MTVEGQPGTWLCRPASEYYLNLSVRVAPQQRRVIEAQAMLLAARDSTAAALELAIGEKDRQITGLRQQLLNTEEIADTERGRAQRFEMALKAEKMKFKIAGGVAIAGGLLFILTR